MDICTCDNLPKDIRVTVWSHIRKHRLGDVVVAFTCPSCGKRATRNLGRPTVAGPPEPDGGDA